MTTKVSAGEELLALHMKAVGISFDRQVRFCPDRKWTFDFVVNGPHGTGLAVEVEGGNYSGGHKRGAAADTDYEKFNYAAMMGWCVLRFSTAMVNDGRALAAIERAVRG